MKLFCGTHPSSAPHSRQINRVIYNMKSSYERFWKSQLGDPYNPTGKLSLYRKIKPAFRMEKFSAANLALAGFPLTNALGESMPSRN